MGEGWGEGENLNQVASFAKKLRKDSTDTERLLWSYIRAKRFFGLKFRRQEPMGKYIVDFICFERRVIIECDGGQHAFQVEKDQERDLWFTEQGYRVLRFWDSDVLNNTEGVLEAILDACRDCPHRSPSPYPLPSRADPVPQLYLLDTEPLRC